MEKKKKKKVFTDKHNYPSTYKKKVEPEEQRKERLKALKELKDFFNDKNTELTLW